MHRKALQLRYAACAAAGLILSGCASVGTQHTTPNGPVATTPTSPTDGSTGNTEVGALPEQPRWQPIPNPNDDLWIRVRNGYQLPAQYGNPAIREWVAYYLQHDKHLRASIRRAQPFLYHVVKAVSERGMPLELALLPIVESGYDASAVSYSGAGGLWQFMPPTANDMGLRQDWWYDARYDALASTRAALDYLTWLHDYFNGDWLLALAAYNGGPGRVGNALERARERGEAADFWHLDLPAETTAYVPKLFALRRLLANPARYGLSWAELPDTPQTIAVQLPAQIEVDIAASMLDMPETRLRELNPGIRHFATAPDHGAADLLVPISKAEAFRVAVAQADPRQLVKRDWYRVRRGDTLSGIAQAVGTSAVKLRRANGLSGSRILIGQRLAIPRRGAPIEQPTRPYEVQPGDTLWQIAHRNGINVAALRRTNNLSGDMLRPGQTLKLPASAAPATYRVAPGDTLWAIASRHDVSIAQLRAWNRLDGNAVLQPGQVLAISGSAPLPDFYHVEDGDTLWAIAERFGVQVATLRHLNDIGSQSTIRPGQRLRLQPAG